MPLRCDVFGDGVGGIDARGVCRGHRSRRECRNRRRRKTLTYSEGWMGPRLGRTTGLARPGHGRHSGGHGQRAIAFEIDGPRGRRPFSAGSKVALAEGRRRPAASRVSACFSERVLAREDGDFERPCRARFAGAVGGLGAFEDDDLLDQRSRCEFVEFRVLEDRPSRGCRPAAGTIRLRVRARSLSYEAPAPAATRPRAYLPRHGTRQTRIGNVWIQKRSSSRRTPRDRRCGPAKRARQRRSKSPFLPGQDPFTRPAKRERRLGRWPTSSSANATFEPAEMAAVRGTIYLEGDRTLPDARRVWPTVPGRAIRSSTPTSRPDPPFRNTSASSTAAIRHSRRLRWPRQKLRGRRSSDTVAEYVDSKGIKRTGDLHRVALCIPRFILVRSEANAHTCAPRRPSPKSRFAQKTPGVVEGHRELGRTRPKLQLELARQTAKPSSTESAYGATVIGAIKKRQNHRLHPNASHAQWRQNPPIVRWKTGRSSSANGPIGLGAPPSATPDLQPFATPTPANSRSENVVVIDRLTPRFEYISPARKTDRRRHFHVPAQSGGSHSLEVGSSSGELRPGSKHGVITFQVGRNWM